MNKRHFLSISVFLAGLCSIIYELLISTTATYFLGDGVRQFSLIIGIYLFAMGVGAYLAKQFADKPLYNFIAIEYLLGLIGGISVPLLYFLFTSVDGISFQLICLGIIFVIGCLTGMEIPLLTFSFKDDHIKDSLSHVLSLDYVGGLMATLIFPFFILPFVGLFYASLIFGIINIVLGLLLNLIYYKRSKKLLAFGLMTAALATSIVIYGGSLLNIWEQKIYKAPIIVNEQTPYQRIVVTKRKENVKLFINRVIQFASQDEHRYHETLVHVPIAMTKKTSKVLVLGGGENLATRELVKYPEIEQIHVVDIDSAIFRIAMDHLDFQQINQLAPYDPRVTLIVDDAFRFLYTCTDKYDLIISDLPDPNNESLSRLYSIQFFNLVKKNLTENGIFITQSGDINNSNQVFNCIHNTLSEIFKKVSIYHVYVPSFGDWDFNIASMDTTHSVNIERLPLGLKYLDKSTLALGSHLPKDVPITDTKINTLDNPVILNYFLEDYARFKSNSE